ncbi:MAG: hypothetical protein ACYCQI_08025 [Gammaproteobacteria bacterium]
MKKHIIALLVEANKQISNIINEMEKANSPDTQIIIDEINDVIRQLDETVELLEEK